MPQASHADAGDRPAPRVWVAQPRVIRAVVAAAEFVGFVGANLPTTGPGSAGRPLPADLAALVVPRLVDLARSLDVALFEPAEGGDSAFLFEPGETLINLGQIGALSRLALESYRLLYSWGWSGRWAGEAPLPGAAAGLSAEVLASLRDSLDILPSPGHLHDEARVCPGCGSIHGPTDDHDDGAGAATRDDPGAVPMADFSGELLARYRLRQPSTLHALKGVLNGVMSLGGVETTADLTPETVVRYRDHLMDLGLSHETIRGRLVVLGTACRHAVERGHLAANPVPPNPKAPTSYRPGPRASSAEQPPDAPPTPEEVTRLLAFLRDGSPSSWERHRLFALAAVVVLAGPPGLRFHEASGLGVDDVDLGRARLALTKRSPVERYRPIPPKLVEVLAGWLPHAGCAWLFPGQTRRGPWREGAPGKKPLHQLQTAGQALGIARLTFDRLRDFRDGRGAGLGLGPEFLGSPIPTPTHGGPRPGRPGRRPVALPPLVELRGASEPPVVRGSTLNGTLTEGQSNVVQAMIGAGCLAGRSLSAKELKKLSGQGDPIKMLRKLRERPPWDSVLRFPGTKGRRGYGFAPA